MKHKEKAIEPVAAISVLGRPFMGIRDAKKLAAIFAEIAENEKAVVKLAVKTTRAYYDAGNIIAAAIRRWSMAQGKMRLNAIAASSGFPQDRITLALKIFRYFENMPDALDGLSLRDALKLIAPPAAAGEKGYNRVDMDGDAGQLDLDFGEVFQLPACANRSLENYRTIADAMSEIILVTRTRDNLLVSKRFARFFEDIPRNPSLRFAYKTMAQKTQAAIEDYLAAVEQEERQA